MSFTVLPDMAHVGLVFLLLVVASSAQDTCPASSGIHGSPGQPGMPGAPGKNGKDGPSGRKGHPGPPGAAGLAGAKGQKGEPGLEGTIGKVGPEGESGEKGEKGARGEKGERGDVGDHTSTLKSAFSMARNTMANPRRFPIKFDKLITNKQGNYLPRSAKFQCQIPGLYYFVYHATSKGNLCINIMLNQVKQVGFCDQVYNMYQVSSGGVVLKLKTNDFVHLEASESSSIIGMDGADSVFNGFLIFPD
ncbi:complement C1q subcomponent subunit B-like [Chiloscyllium plagiosum]|uniref:complement C1q subcomponent subunit B-like n=1 Tax=Chiloscyllium plagiosum TaxID=36176 RepID=UPI001CB85040|nr:complement C1q subcomponent subunit B-like [Chiloscyllium plagiosum]